MSRRRLRHVRPAALLAAVALLVPGAAHAATPAPQAFPLAGDAWARANAIAVAHWGATPCAGKVDIAWAALEPLTNARATWHNPTDPWGSPQTNFNCRIDFNAATSYDFPMLCTVLTHEIGHLLGRKHEGEGLVMSAIYSTPIPSCQSAAPAAATPAPAPAAPAAAAAAPAASTASTPPAARKTRRPAAKRAASCASQRAKSRKVKRCTARTASVQRAHTRR